ncbi:hypothetical protein [Bounagaea algeriensis]
MRRTRTQRAHEHRAGRRPRGALAVLVAVVSGLLLFAVPAAAQGLDCSEPPNPERPGSGMVGALDPAPIGTGEPGSTYDEVGYAGLVWHTYDLGCGPQGVTSPHAVVDTWLGNELFNIAKNIVGATNGLHYALLDGELLDPLDELIATGTVALYDSVFSPWFGLVAVVLAVVLFRYIWQGDLATIGRRTMWGLAALWFASATYLTPLVYTHVLDDVVVTGTSSVQAGFLREVGVDQTHALPTLLHDQVIYTNWLRGEFGSPDSPQAQELGRDLLRAQTWTKQEAAAGEDSGSPESKKQQFEQVVDRSGSARSYIQGIDGSRVGAGTLAMLQSFAYAVFQLLAKAAILLAQVLLRVLILAGPLLGLVSIVYHQVLRGIGKIAGAAVLNVVLISAMAGLHTLILTWIFQPARSFSALTQIMLAGLVTLVFLMVCKPVRRMGQMVELSVGGMSSAVPRVPPSLFSRFRGRADRGRADGGGSEEGGDFWDQLRGDGASTAAAGDNRTGRPEASHPSVTATAVRLDQDRSGTADDAGGASAAGGRRPGAGALPEAGSTSRIVDTVPVADAQWDNIDDDPVLVPSRVDGESRGVRPAPAREPGSSDRTGPDRTSADREVVAGRPVNVVYRPSRGLEVADGTDHRSRGGA